MRFFQQKQHPHLSSYLAITVISAILLTLSACGDSDNNDNTSNNDATYDITVYNLTNGQPFTPLGIVVHDSAYMPWQLGETVTMGLETLAESGDPSAFLTEANADSAVVMSTSSSNGPFGPGNSETVSITVDHAASLQLTVASMLANTNDAFTGIRNWNIGELAVGDSVSTMARVYDAGTEANNETAGSMPGPAAMGEGFNVVRDDLDRLAVHSGVVTADDGLLTSALNESHRWLGQAAKVMVTRTQ
ncbi:MAG: spondin domain-containing protein [Gammaproteobacteria bacterium]|nr:spondin domain-containing protein [Gammaproteobacteria bacterium]MCF6259946.1 spondin domain-containing protein [Gammaproteobacteria bacterium]